MEVAQAAAAIDAPTLALPRSRWRASSSPRKRVEYATTTAQLKVVMAGLDPAIHVVATSAGDGGKRVDARVEPAHDDLQLVTITIQQPAFIPRTALSFAKAGIQGGSTTVAPGPPLPRG